WFDMTDAKTPECICCGRRQFEFLEGSRSTRTAALCGRDAVQVAAPPGAQVDFAAIAARLQGVAAEPPRLNRFMLRFRIATHEITLFNDGRAIIKGTSNPDEARTIYAKYIGT